MCNAKKNNGSNTSYSDSKLIEKILNLNQKNCVYVTISLYIFFYILGTEEITVVLN